MTHVQFLVLYKFGALPDLRYSYVADFKRNRTFCHFGGLCNFQFNYILDTFYLEFSLNVSVHLMGGLNYSILLQAIMVDYCINGIWLLF